MIFLSVQLFSQTQSLAYRSPFSASSHLQSDSISFEKRTMPFPSVKKMVFQEIAGVGLGLVAASIGGGFGALLGNNSGHDSFFSYGTLIGIFSGYTMGNAAGVYWVGNTKELHGSFCYTLVGSSIGVATGFYISSLTHNTAPVFILPGIGGIIAFYLSAEEVVPAKTDALVQIQNEKVQFSTPKIFLTRIDETSNKLRYNFELLRVNF
ncbi:MAG: hypothetical protein A2057_14380 [Ignavibacteria bacterium GWA2_35_9]|nr:MAG: hypothetical protein A2057_14380 [Ignavibacteria bacterium GWA2_35_9]